MFWRFLRDFFVSVVYILIPTSSHNILTLRSDNIKLYIFWFLHQTTTWSQRVSAAWCCISFDSYIKPQRSICCLILLLVVYLLIPTSNHNTYIYHDGTLSLYIFWFLHQTTTGLTVISLVMCCISFDSYIKPQPSARTP